MSEPILFGGIISKDPLIVIGKRSYVTNNRLGLMSLKPELFHDRVSLTFLTHTLPYHREDEKRLATVSLRTP